VRNVSGDGGDDDGNYNNVYFADDLIPHLGSPLYLYHSLASKLEIEKMKN